MFEHYSQPVLPHFHFRRRVLRSAFSALVMAGGALGIGVIGYHTLGGLGWVDAVLEASMILGGMGAIAPMTNDTVKIFASAYALFSGIIVLGTVSIIMAPWLHRLLHRLHQKSGA